MAIIEVEAIAVVPPLKATVADAKQKKVKTARKASIPKKAAHPPFYEMVSDVIVTLKERTGSSQYAIQKFAEEKHKQLPANFRKMLLVQLRKFAASGKLLKVKNSYKLPAATKSVSSSPKPVAKKSTASTKPKPTTPAKKSVAKKPVSKAVEKKKSKDVAKPKTAAAKPKAKSVKVAKKSAKSSPAAKKAPAKVKATKRAAAPSKKAVTPAKKAALKPKKVKSLKFVKSPAKRASARKVAK